MYHRKSLLGLLILVLVSSCTPSLNTPVPTQVTSKPITTLDPLFISDGGGEPRGAGYWLVWNTCTEGNQAATAKSNGGREAGWILLDDLLVDPGILLGGLELKTCDQATGILQKQTPVGISQDLIPLHYLAAELLTAQLNLSIPTETCPAAEQAVQAAQLLLISAGYQGDRNSITLNDPEGDIELAEFLTAQLEQYNLGTLCR